MIATLHTPENTETHANHIPHVDVMNTGICKSIVVIDYARNDVKNDNITDDSGSIATMAAGKRLNNTNFDSSYSFLHHAGDFTEIVLDTKTCQAQVTHDVVHLENQKTSETEDQNATIANDDGSDDGAASVRVLSNLNHEEEIKTIEEIDRSCRQDIRDYKEDHEYSHHRPSMAILNTLPFSHYSEIYGECVRSRCSSVYTVYTDHLIYARESLLALEVVPCQWNNVTCFEYLREGSNDILYSQYDRSRSDYMLVYSYAKTNAAGIFYSHCWPRDTFDLKTLLKPSIHVTDPVARDVVANTHLYHRCVNNYHVRVPRAGCAPMTFCHNRETTMSCTERIQYNNTSDYYIDHPSDPLIHASMQRSKNGDDTREHRQNRSSLLLLEPLLLMPESTSSEYRKNIKNRILRSKDRVKIVRIIIAYILSFLILASITFYIVYFT